MSNKFVSIKSSSLNIGTSQGTVVAKKAETGTSNCFFDKRFFMGIAFALGVTVSAPSHSTQASNCVQQPKHIEKIAKSSEELKTYSLKNKVANSNANAIGISFKLQKELGFTKVSQWAAVVHVERKTIYDWQKNPNTKVQAKIVDRISTLDQFNSELTDSHRKFLAKMTFGKLSDDELRSELTKETLDISKLLEHYDRLYLEFDGLAKRQFLDIA